jgi:hypothetical protein
LLMPAQPPVARRILNYINAFLKASDVNACLLRCGSGD